MVWYLLNCTFSSFSLGLPSGAAAWLEKAEKQLNIENKWVGWLYHILKLYF